MSKGKDSFYCKYTKRGLDIFCASSAMVALSPLLIVTSILVRINMGSPVLFRQERIGKDEKPFHGYKFQTKHFDNKNYQNSSIISKNGWFI